MNKIKVNNIYNSDCIEFLDLLEDGCLDLIIADPPYFRILKREEWDKFSNFDDYLNWSKIYLKKCIEKLRYSGTLLIYGCSVSISTMSFLNEILIQNGMYFVEEIVINKGIKSIAGRVSSKIKMLPPVSENIFVYRKDAKPFVKKILLNEKKKSGLSTRQIKSKLGMPLNGGGNWTKYCGDTEFPLLPTKEHWEKICELFNISISYLEIEEVYNGSLGLTNVWDDIQFYTKNRKHPSEKPIQLAERCIQLFSRENDLIYIPFAGSGNDILACIKNNRNWVATEIDSGYFQIIKERLSNQ